LYSYDCRRLIALTPGRTECAGQIRHVAPALPQFARKRIVRIQFRRLTTAKFHHSTGHCGQLQPNLSEQAEARVLLDVIPGSSSP
jgi:hypothetical protein